MPTSLWWNHLSDHPLVQWGITRGASQEASLPKGAFKIKKLKKLNFNLIFAIIYVLMPFSRTTVTFKMISVKMWYLIRAAVKNVRINLGQLRIKCQIDLHLCDSIFTAYVRRTGLITIHSLEGHRIHELEFNDNSFI